MEPRRGAASIALAAVMAIVGLGPACTERRHDVPGASSSPPAASSVAAAAPAPSAPPVVCAPTEVALDGGCATLPPHLEADDLLLPGHLGLLNAWSTIAPLSAGAAAELDGAALDLTPIGGDAAARATCDRDGFVGGPGKDREGGERSAVHLAWVVASGDLEVDLWASVAGSLEVRLGDAPPLRFEEVRGGDARPLLDEAAARVRLRRGTTPIAVVHRRTAERSGGFFLRLRDPRGEALRGVRVAPRIATARCAHADLLDVHPTVLPVMDGDRPAFAVSLTPRFEGLAPAVITGELRLVGALRRGRDREGAARTEPLLQDAMRNGTASARLLLPAPARGEGQLEITAAGGEGAPLATVRVRALPKELHARVARLVAGLTSGASSHRGARDSLAHHVAVLARAVAAGEKDTGWLEAHTRRAEDVAAALARGEDPYPAARGWVWRAHRSALDGQLQPYVVSVPPSADRAAPLPVVVVAHGMDRLPEHALRTLVGHPPDEHTSLDFAAKHLPRLPDLGAILVAPWQHGNAGPHALGEADLIAVLDEVAATWRVDPHRVSITGYSLGGTVAFVAPVRWPDRFAAAAPLCGYPNLMDYRSVRSAPKTPWEPALLAREYAVGMLENASQVPFHVVHGGKDVPGRSKIAVDRLRDLGQPVVWNLIEDADHDVWSEAYEDGKMIGWLTRHRRPAAPRRVRLITGEYRVDRSAWLRIVGLDDDGAAALASIDAAFDPGAASLTVKARGVAAFVVDRAGLPDAKGLPADPGAVRVTVDGRDLGEVAAGAPIVVARGADGALALAPEVPSRAGMKRHGVSGPIEDALFHPLVVVRGTADPSLAEANRLVAEHAATAMGTAAVRYPVLVDVEATDEALRGKSVILVGGPPSNLLARRWQDALPARFEAGAIVLRGKRYAGPDVAVSLIAPRPGDADQVLVLHGGLSERGTLAARHLPRYLPDWVVYDGRVAGARGGLLFGDRPTLDGGFFDPSWR